MLLQTTPYLFFAGVELPPRAMLGAKESLSVIGDVETDRDLHGNLILLQPSWMSLSGDELFQITLSASGDGVDTALLDGLKVGTELTFYSGTWWVGVIPAGQTTFTMRRDPVPGSVTGRNPRIMTPHRIDITVDGRTGSILEAVDHPVNGYYRSIMGVTVTRREIAEFERFGKGRGYTLTLEETHPQGDA